ncbi:hypothetical protein FIBSPDRAFT_905012 [Athelia psychrophila]|uniref:Uncharacterized protein n=1 Tax=Athelia psychrophila TaxID=1759441 RepID=A0A167TZT7_9AGAM|nr:hypothetical protein FIBSPDRAFT_905012 [Fibularhizoctonia sp. CBS 109695]
MIMELIKRVNFKLVQVLMLFATQPALTTHKRGCAASKKRFSNAIDGGKLVMIARKKTRTAALLNLGTSESTSSSVVATQPTITIPSISPPKNTTSATEDIDPALSAFTKGLIGLCHISLVQLCQSWKLIRQRLSNTRFQRPKKTHSSHYLHGGHGGEYNFPHGLEM